MLDILNLMKLQGVDPSIKEFSTNCPECINRVGKEDTKQKLGVNLEKKVFHCFRCGYKGRLDVDEVDTVDDSSIDDMKSRLDGLFSGMKKVESHMYNLEDISFPLTTNTPAAYRYVVEDRGISLEEAAKYNIRVGKSFEHPDGYTSYKWRNRIIFPFVEDSSIVYLVGRSYTGREPKYVNSRGSKSSFLYGIDAVNGQCLICEGIISSIAASRASGIPSVALLGKFISELQLEKLRSKSDSVILSLDGDVSYTETESMISKLLLFGFRVRTVIIPKGYDPDDLKDEYLSYFNNSKEIMYMSDLSKSFQPS